MENYFETTVIRVKQPLGEFYVAAIPAHVLLETAYSRRLFAESGKDGRPYTLEGAQRAINDKRLKDVGQYINRDDAAFPNSIILAPNFSQTESETDDNGTKRRFTRNKEVRWRIEITDDGSSLKLIIPESIKLAQIIDGQHRLYGFSYANPDRLDCQLLCSLYFDLPEPMQAQIFATINSKQKQVDRSLTYELFGYNIGDETPSYWGPDKLAVFLSRKLNAESSSPLKKRILVSAENDFALSRSEARKEGWWMLSLATVVDGILRLITRSVEKDLSELSEKRGAGRDTLQVDKAPLRDLYLSENDQLLYSLLVNYFASVQENIWDKANLDSFILKTVGFQAIFDILHKYLSEIGLKEKRFSKAFFDSYVEKASHIDFSDRFFKNASGSGRIVIRNCLEIAMGFKAVDAMENDREEYERVCGVNKID